MPKLTQDQVRELNDCFVMFDKDNKGYILSQNLREVLKCLGYNPMDKELQILQLTVDNDGNGQIDFQEFLNLIECLDGFYPTRAEEEGKKTYIFMLAHNDKPRNPRVIRPTPCSC